MFESTISTETFSVGWIIFADIVIIGTENVIKINIIYIIIIIFLNTLNI